MTTTKSTYETLAAVDVSQHVERKNGFSYVSWSHAIHELLRRYPEATFGHDEWGPPEARTPYCRAPGRGYLVRAWCEVGGVRRSQQHAVTDARNQPIAEPTCADISNSIQRAMVKALALHGLGLSVYAGEDLRFDDDDARPTSPPSSSGGASAGTGKSRASRPASAAAASRSAPSATAGSPKARDILLGALRKAAACTTGDERRALLRRVEDSGALGEAALDVLSAFLHGEDNRAAGKAPEAGMDAPGVLLYDEAVALLG
jgi:hypothetical protein